MTEENKKKISLKEFFKVISWIFKIYYKLSPINTILVIITNALIELKGLFYAYIFALVIDKTIVISESASKDIKDLFPLLILLFIYSILVESFIKRLFKYSSRCLRHLSYSEIERLLYEKYIHLEYKT